MLGKGMEIVGWLVVMITLRGAARDKDGRVSSSIGPCDSHPLFEGNPG